MYLFQEANDSHKLLAHIHWNSDKMIIIRCTMLFKTILRQHLDGPYCTGLSLNCSFVNMLHSLELEITTSTMGMVQYNFI